MSEPSLHLPGIDPLSVTSPRLATHALACGPARGEPILLLHGNLASSTYWEETILALPARYRAVAPDLRGYGESDPSACIDATRGFAEWADDALALVDELGWESFHLIGHSMGGCIAWALLGIIAERIASVTLVAPGPPCGFGGTSDDRGTLNHPDGAGSGAGLVQQSMLSQLTAGLRGRYDDPQSPRGVLNRLCWAPPFRPEREEQLLSAMFQMHRGEGRFPGDMVASPHWPGFAPGVSGPINAMSPKYNGGVLPRVEAVSTKPRMLWVRGELDPIISDCSPSDAGAQGKLGLRPGWPGDSVFPPQPVLQQVAFAADAYERIGGEVRRLCMEGVGHTPYLERPAAFQAALVGHLEG